MKVVFGGTFDPVHVGHLRLGTALAEALRVETVDLMPCHVPVHKASVSATPAQRLKMLELALIGDPVLRIDDRELASNEPSYSIHSLRQIRSEIGDEPLVLAMGTDSLKGLPSWFQSDAFAKVCHIVVVDRPEAADMAVGDARDVSGAHVVVDSSPVKVVSDELGFRLATEPRALFESSCGSMLSLRLNLLDVSSSDMRSLIAEGRSVRYLTPSAVCDYICDNALYRS